MEKRKKLSALEHRAFIVITDYYAIRGYAPTHKEIASLLWLKGKQIEAQASSLIRQLRRKGWLKKSKPGWRNAEPK